MEINSSGTIENHFSSKFCKSNSTEFYTILKLYFFVLMVPMVPLNNKIRFHGIPWNWHQQFHVIPWNFECSSSITRAVPWNSIEFHGTWSAPISLTRAVLRNCMEFHGTWSAPISLTRAVPWNSMEFHGTGNTPISLTRAVPWNSMELRVRQFHWHEQFHGIPWNFECANFDDTNSSMEFPGTSSAPISIMEQFLEILGN